MNLRARASGLHFLISTAVALLSGLLVFLVWYPPPYAMLAGGLSLFGMLVGIDVVLGPLLTAIVAQSSKPRRELRRDIGFIVFVQLLALGYGMYTIALARPVHMVFEVDRFRVISAADIEPAQLANAPPGYRELPWTGPTVIAARKSATQEEMLHSLDLSIQGVDISMQPERWSDYASSTEEVLKKARPAKLLLEKYPHISGELQAIVTRYGMKSEDIYFLPLLSRKTSAVALVTPPDAHIIGYIDVEGFF